MDDEQLIDCVRKYSVLYDLSHAKYMDPSYKSKIWKEIGKEMKTQGQLCKARWSNIRDTFRKYLKKNLKHSGRDGKITKKYKYADQLSFLKNHLNERETKSKNEAVDNLQNKSGEIAPADEKSYSGDEIEQDVGAVSQEMRQERDEVEQKTNEQREDWSASMQRTEKLPVHEKTTASGNIINRRKLAYSQATAEAELIDYSIAKTQVTQVNTRVQPDAVEAFLTGIAPTLKSLSPLSFHFAKSELFDIVQKYELEALGGQNAQGTYSYNDPTSATAVSMVSPVPSQCSSISEVLKLSPDYTE